LTGRLDFARRPVFRFTPRRQERQGILETITVSLRPTSTVVYDIRIGPGLLDGLPEMLEKDCPAHRYAVIADGNVAGLYGGKLRKRLQAAGLVADVFPFPAGEESKTREIWAELTDDMLARRIGRDAAVLALGGGVTGDLAGFVAATYLRGLPLVQLPTSLLAMVDSSVGGKTGVDTPAGKNLVGSFHQPHLVVADTDCLATLPPRELRSGLAETIKSGAIADVDYLTWIEENSATLPQLDATLITHLVKRSVEIKAGVVVTDERETGLRKILNFGHTIGHAIEALSRFELLHGEAIAIGMIVEAEIGELLGITELGTGGALRRVLGSVGLPIAVPSAFSAEPILELTRVDKKARSGRVEYSLLERVGTPSAGSGSYGTIVPDEVVVEALARSR
jgi:3-dehydroquinate synthase